MAWKSFTLPTFSSRRWLIGGGGLIVLVLVGGLVWQHVHAKRVAAKAAAARPPPAVPVTVVAAQTADFPVFLNGLGTVQPYDTVTVRSRVDGQITKIAFRQGQMVNAGDLLVQIDPRPYQAALDQARAKKAQDEASLKDAQLNLQRYGLLNKQQFASRQQFDTQASTVDQLIAQIEGDQAMIDNAQTQVSYTTITSPLAGRAGFRLVDPGNIVHAADTTGIVTIVKLQPISVVFTATEDELPQISRALAAGTVPAIALSTNGATTIAQGKLALIDNNIDQASGTISMKATFENVDNALWPGLSVSTRLQVDMLKGVVVIPSDAVQHGPNGRYVYLVGEDNKAAMQEIKVGPEDNGRSVVLQGLAAGQKVVTEGQYRVQPGTLLQPNPPAPATPTTTPPVAKGTPVASAQTTPAPAP
jgi:multidrug efflux system membrane fusion protein